jgi:hypothetical protein
MQGTRIRRWLCLVALFFGGSLQVQANTWTYTGRMNQARTYFTATVLNNGEVLVVGGTYRGTFVQYGLTSAELYNPSTGTFTTTGSLHTGRYGHLAALLSNGKVLIAGGQNSTSGALSSAELYDPSTGTFTATGNMLAAGGNSATPLGNGKVLIVDSSNTDPTGAELYDPSTGTFTATGSVHISRGGASATLLGNGEVLVAGGYNTTTGYLTSAELYNPITGAFSLTAGSLHTARAGQSATVLANGEVLLAAGQNSNTQNYGYLGGAELYNPSTGKFTTTGSLNTPRFLHQAVLLPSGEVLIVAGNHFGSLSSAELYNPSTGKFTNAASLNAARQGQQSVLLTNGELLTVGGYENLGRLWLASAELYQ